MGPRREFVEKYVTPMLKGQKKDATTHEKEKVCCICRIAIAGMEVLFLFTFLLIYISTFVQLHEPWLQAVW